MEVEGKKDEKDEDKNEEEEEEKEQYKKHRMNNFDRTASYIIIRIIIN